MTTLTPPLPDAAAGEAARGSAARDRQDTRDQRRGRLSDLSALLKARLVGLVLLTTAAGFVMAERGPLRWDTLLLTLLGTAMVAGSAMVLNQLLEVERDALMQRTRLRPLPAGRIGNSSALLLGGALGVLGIGGLLLLVHPLAAILAGANLLLYAFVYTPLKTRTTLNTVVGAVTGAIPPMIGWAAAAGSVDPRTQWGAWLLGSILFLWQLPHFLALAWMYREDYSRGGFRMLPQVDRDGRLTAQVVLLSSLALIPASLMAVGGGLAGPLYALGAFLLGLMMVALAVGLMRARTDRAARRVFFASLFYLPLLLGLMVFDHDWQHLRAPEGEARSRVESAPSTGPSSTLPASPVAPSADAARALPH